MDLQVGQRIAAPFLWAPAEALTYEQRKPVSATAREERGAYVARISSPPGSSSVRRRGGSE